MKKLIGVVGLLLIAPFPAHAVHTVTVCGETCNNGEQCIMDRNLSCATSPGVTLAGSADFDFKGFTITCSGCTAVTSVGVLVSNSSSNTEIEDSVGGGGVVGAWGIGINCNYNTNSQVNDVRVSNAGDIGIAGCRKVRGAVVTSAQGADGIVNWQLSASDYIKDSYITGGNYGIWLEGSGAAQIDHNSIAGNGSFMILSQATTSSSLQITGNSLFSNGSNYPILVGSTPPITSGNVCGDPTDASCADCISEGVCSAANTPFVGP